MWLWVDKISLNINKSHFILFKTRKNYVNLFFFGILMNVCSVMYYIFLHTDPYEHVGKKEKKRKEKKAKHIYIADSHTITYW